MSAHAAAASERSCVHYDPSVARELCPSVERSGKPSAAGVGWGGRSLAHLFTNVWCVSCELLIIAKS